MIYKIFTKHRFTRSNGMYFYVKARNINDAIKHAQNFLIPEPFEISDVSEITPYLQDHIIYEVPYAE